MAKNMSKPQILKRILIIDDHDMFAKGLVRLFNQTNWANVIATATTAAEGLRLIEELKPDILLLDLYLGKTVSLKIIPQVKESSPDTKIVILTISDCIEDILATAEYDIDGYILKNTDFEQFELYLNDIVKGNVRASDSLASLLFTEFLSNAKNKNLTLREREVADLLKQGLSNKEIAATLNLSLYTVKCHVSSIIKKQKLTNRYELLNKN